MGDPAETLVESDAATPETVAMLARLVEVVLQAERECDREAPARDQASVMSIAAAVARRLPPEERFRYLHPQVRSLEDVGPDAFLDAMRGTSETIAARLARSGEVPIGRSIPSGR